MIPELQLMKPYALYSRISKVVRMLSTIIYIQVEFAKMFSLQIMSAAIEKRKQVEALIINGWRIAKSTFWLVEIIEPKTIICLGRKAFDCVLTAAGEPKSQGCYNNTILKGAVSMSINDVTVQVYPMAHPGSMGTLNRCRSCDNDTKVISRERGIELQSNDWKKIKV